MSEFKTKFQKRDPKRLRSQAKGLHDKRAADALYTRASELDFERKAYMSKHADAISVSSCMLQKLRVLPRTGMHALIQARHPPPAFKAQACLVLVYCTTCVPLRRRLPARC